MNVQDAFVLCSSHMHRYVLVRTTDGGEYDGFVEYVDQEWLYLAVPLSVRETNNERAWYAAAYPYVPFYPPYPGYDYYPRRPFGRVIIPLAALAALTLLPYY